MTLSKKATLGLSLMVLTVVLIATTAFYGINRLSNTLEYLVGPAWDSADGAMETTIELQQQIRMIERMLAGKPVDDNELNASRDAASEAHQRLENAGIVNSRKLEALRVQRKEWEQQGNTLKSQYAEFSNLLSAFRDTTAELVTLLEELEEKGDAAVEELENNPGTRISWDTGLREKWEAADGGMETTIGLLQQLYFLERLLRGESAQSIRTEIAEAADFTHDAMGSMLGTNSFNGRSSIVPGMSQAQALQTLMNDFDEQRDRLISQYITYTTTNERYQSTTKALLAMLEEVEEAGDSMVESQVEASAGTVSFVFLLMSIAFIAGLAMAGVLTILTRKAVVRPIRSIAYRIHNIATGDGDLTKRTALHRNDEIGDLSSYVDEFIERLQVMIKRIKHSGSAIRVLVTDTGKSAITITTSAQQTASQADEVAVASEQMSQVSAEIANNCVNAAQNAEKASTLAQSGQRRVQDTISSMQAITDRVSASSESIASLKDQADKIGEIVSVITAISAQTNLLALNAAIEAARAGEQGRGFAVVADEVRTLAQKTDSSTSEIGEVIKAIQDQTQRCFELMESCVDEVSKGKIRSGEAGESLTEIRAQMDDLTMMINQISAATEQQTITISDVSLKVQSIADLAQQSNADAKQTQNHVLQLNKSSDELDSELAQFKV
ncbi:methyl-accepting chemotaxis protein [Alteromonas sp. AMM-1]|uniref:methyl-accepting chemotaxis protein n=1 Tax=Alteromonas sp. AMM-1 TaxID=3394233 RepID=UPI0039A6D20F